MHFFFIFRDQFCFYKNAHFWGHRWKIIIMHRTLTIDCKRIRNASRYLRAKRVLAKIEIIFHYCNLVRVCAYTVSITWNYRDLSHWLGCNFLRCVASLLLPSTVDLRNRKYTYSNFMLNGQLSKYSHKSHTNFLREMWSLEYT